ncbi:MAG: hypothetical protein HQM08_11465 [Candidatus Riflebacteria bacterium]|nr:hypothetical protein [Candidatus Riflebacteria bacterium]
MNLLKEYFNEPLDWRRYQVGLYCLGIVLFSLGAKGFIDAKLGTDPLDVLVIGMNKHLGVGLGICSSLVAIGFLTWWMTWNRQLPPLTPFVSTSAVGFLLDFWNSLHLENYTIGALPIQNIVLAGHTLNISAVGLDVVALLTCSYASALIIMSGIGIRIMDLVAITMIERWDWSFFRAKMTLETGLFTLGWFLGGPMGGTTVLFLFLVGPFIQPFMWMNAIYLNIPNHGIKDANQETMAEETALIVAKEIAG